MKSKAIKRMLALFLTLTIALGGTTIVFAAESTNLASAKQAAEETELINLQSEWRYLDNNTDPAGAGGRTSWTVLDFDDSSWKTSAGHHAKFGAKRGGIQDLGNNSTPEILLNQYIENSTTDIPAYFFRTSFELDSQSAELALIGTLKYDDAAIVYVNGTKVAAFDEPDGGFNSNLSYGGSNASDPKEVTFTVDSSVLQKGINVVAVELHQGRESSSDIYFEMSSLKLAKVVVEQSSVSLTVGADETQMNFTWYCNQSGNGMIYLAKQSDLVNGEMPENAQIISAAATAANKSGYYSNQATATGLERDTMYAYQLVNGDTKSAIMTFTTTDQQRAFSFAFVGDPQIGAGNRVTDTEGWDNTLNIMNGNSLFDGIDFLLSAGDQVNSAGSEEEYDGFLEHSALTGMPIATVVGNHDSGSDSYAQHFNVPNESVYGETTASSDYYFVYNHVLFLVLNSNNRSAAEHKAFMEAAIADTADQDIAWKIVTFHHSIYSVASHAVDDDILQRRTELVPIFQELDIDVVLMGHDHVYCRTYMMDGLEPMTDAALYDNADYSSITNPTGILYVTANSGSGSKYYNIKTSLDFPYSRVMNQERVPNISRVDVSDESFTITTYRTNDMSVVDTFTINRAHIHNAVAKEAVPATCTQDGTAAYWYCEDCGKYFSDADCTNEIVDRSELTVSAKGHTAGEPVVAETTCTAPGSEIVSCTVCKAEISNEVIPAKGHTAGEPVVVEPTCTAPGSEIVTCTACKAEISNEVIPAKGHTAGEPVVVEPTCTAPGSEIVSCTVCKEEISNEAIPAKGHTAGEPVIVESTCETHGSVTISCKDCGAEISAAELPLAEHTPSEAIVVDPTATEDGSSTVKCAICSKILSVERIPATGIKADEPAAPEKPGNNTSVTDNSTAADTTISANNNNKAPQTGDSSNVAFGIVMILVSFIGFAGVGIYFKRKKIAYKH